MATTPRTSPRPRSGKRRQVDVFTMSPNASMPEEGIDLFGDFVIKTNPNARIMVQASWSACDGKGTTPSVGGTGGGDFKNDRARQHHDGRSRQLDRRPGSARRQLSRPPAHAARRHRQARRQADHLRRAVLDRGLHAAQGSPRRPGAGRRQAVGALPRPHRPPDARRPPTSSPMSGSRPCIARARSA